MGSPPFLEATSGLVVATRVSEEAEKVAFSDMKGTAGAEGGCGCCVC